MMNILFVAAQLLAAGAGISTGLASYELTKSSALKNAEVVCDIKEQELKQLGDLVIRRQNLRAVCPEVTTEEDINKLKAQFKSEERNLRISRSEAKGDPRRKALCAGIGVIVWGVLKHSLDKAF